MSEQYTSNTWKIKICSYDCGLLDNVVKNLITMAKTLMVGVKVISLPVNNKRFALLKSSFVYGKSKEHLLLRTHARALFLELGPNRTINIFNNLQIPSGVTFEVKKVHKKI